MKILISGNLGFIFSHFTEYLLKHCHHVTGIDALYDGSHHELIEEFRNKYTENYKQYISDINDISSLNIEDDYDWVVHAAAESNVDKSLHNKDAFIHSNIMGTYKILDWCIDKKIKNFLLINTDEVYGSNESPVDTNTPLKPGNPYSASKACQSMILNSYKNTYGLNTSEVRMCNVIGPRQATTKLIPRIIDCIKNNKEFPLYDGGIPTREYIDVRDVCEILLEIISNNLYGVYNISFGQEYSILQVIEKIENVMNGELKIIQSSRTGHDFHYRLCPSDICLHRAVSGNYFKLENTIGNILCQ